MTGAEIRETAPARVRTIDPFWVWEMCTASGVDRAREAVMTAIADNTCMDPQGCCKIVRAFGEGG